MFQNCNLYHFLNFKKQHTAFSKNTYYRFLNESGYNWKRFLTLLAVRRKPEAAVKMIHDALVAGIQAAYVLMDTWLTNEPFIKKVLDESIDVIGMLKDNRQRYYYKGRLYNLKQLATLMDFDRPCSVFGSVCVKTMKYRIPVKLVSDIVLVYISSDCISVCFESNREISGHD